MEWYEASEADPEHILFLHYEEILDDTPASIKKIAAFAGIDTTPEVVEKVRLMWTLGLAVVSTVYKLVHNFSCESH